MNPTQLKDIFALLQGIQDRLTRLENQSTVSTRRLVIERQINGHTVKYSFAIGDTTATLGQMVVTATVDNASAHSEVIGNLTQANQLATLNAVISAIPAITSLTALTIKANSIEVPTIIANDADISRVSAGQVTVKTSNGDALDDYIIGVNTSNQLITVNQTTSNVTLIGSP